MQFDPPWLGPCKAKSDFLLLGDSAAPFRVAVGKLDPFGPSLVRAGELRAGPLAMRVWLVRLGAYYHSASAPH